MESKRRCKYMNHVGNLERVLKVRGATERQTDALKCLTNHQSKCYVPCFSCEDDVRIIILIFPVCNRKFMHGI